MCRNRPVSRRRNLVATGALALAITIPGLSYGQADVKAGAGKAAQCFSCHGANGIAQLPDTPNLAGQKVNYLVKSIRDYKTGARKNEIMASMVRNLSEDDIAQVAAYYSHIPVTVKAPK
jgi:cytochrome c553